MSLFTFFKDIPARILSRKASRLSPPVSTGSALGVNTAVGCDDDGGGGGGGGGPPADAFILTGIGGGGGRASPVAFACGIGGGGGGAPPVAIRFGMGGGGGGMDNAFPGLITKVDLLSFGIGGIGPACD